jgi:hypothetical protein
MPGDLHHGFHAACRHRRDPAFPFPFGKRSRAGLQYVSQGRVFRHQAQPQYNHELRLSDLHAVDINGAQYYSFVIDINEPNAGTMSLITLDSLQIYSPARQGRRPAMSNPSA